MKKKILVAALIIAALSAGWCFMRAHESAQDETITFSGNIELTDVQLSFRIPGELAQRPIDEGMHVSAGQVVARLDRTTMEIQLDKAAAQVRFSQALLAELETGSRSQEIATARAELSRAQAGLAKARATLDQAASDRERYADLLREGGTSQRDFELVETGYKTALRSHDEARALVEAARQRLSLFEEGARTEKIEQARARLALDRQNLRQARVQLAYTELHAPFDGTVLSTTAEPGEYLYPGSAVLSVADLGHVWLRAYIAETDLGRVSLGQAVDVTTDSLPGTVFTGRIGFISDEAEFTPKAVQTREERVKLVYRIKVDLPNPHGSLKAGMPADGRIVTGR